MYPQELGNQTTTVPPQSNCSGGNQLKVIAQSAGFVEIMSKMCPLDPSVGVRMECILNKAMIKKQQCVCASEREKSKGMKMWGMSY